MAIAHSWLGERYILQRLFKRDNLPIILGDRKLTQGVLRMAWHATTLAWLGMGSVLAYSQSAQANIHMACLWMIVLVFTMCGIASLYWARGKHLSWIICFAIAGLVFLSL